MRTGRPPKTDSKKVAQWRAKILEQTHLKLELENRITLATILNRSELATRLATIADALTSRIMASPLSREAKEDLLKDIASIPYAIQEVASAQTRIASTKEARTAETSEDVG